MESDFADLKKIIEDFVRESKKVQQNHNDALYGFMNDKNEWIKGVVQISQEIENRKKTAYKMAGWFLFALFSAIAIVLVDVFLKFWRFITGQFHGV